MIRVVLDTNIIVSALLQPLGPPAQIFVMTLGGAIQLYVSGNVYAEYEEVLHRPRLQFSEETVAAALGSIRECSVWVRPTEKIHACVDPDDNIFLECAQAARAHYLVSGNLRHFPEFWAETQIVTPRWLIKNNSGIAPERTS